VLATIEALPPGRRPPYLDAQARRFGAQLSNDPAGYEAAAARFRDIGLPFHLAVTLLEQAELTGDGESLAEAREIFENLKATPWLERAAAAVPVSA
jgi:hypothetical protein